jgi:ABC-type oligopeptide transport system substrate-binding subunit
VFRYLLREPTSLDISVVTYNADGTQFLFERLVMLDENNEMVPGAAQRWERSGDGRTWTFHLRRDARWSDGRPVTAQDWVYTYRRLLDPASGNVFAFFYYDIKNARAVNQGLIKDPAAVGVTAKDDHTFVIETERPCPYLPYITSFPTSAPVPRWQVEKYGNRWTEAGNCVSNASYRLDTWDHGRQMSFALNPYYTGPNKGYLERIVGLFFSDAGPGTLPYENGEVDRHVVDAMDMDRVLRDPALSRELDRSPFPATWYLFFKTGMPPFNDVRVRQAVAHAIDRKSLCSVVLRGSVVPAYTMIPPTLPGYVGEKYAGLQVYDTERARRLLAEAGFPNGRGFPRTDMWLRQAAPNIKAAAVAVQGMLKSTLGIDINVRDQEQKVFTDNMVNRTMPMAMIGYTYDYPDPSDMLGLVWHSQPAGYGRHDWKNARFDDLVDRAAVELDPEKRMAMYDEAERVLAGDAGGVFLFHTLAVELRKPWVKGIKRDRWGNYPLTVQNTTFMDLYIGQH